MEIWAHRGRPSPDRPGNNRNDFILSHNLGVTGIETDICFTADKKVIIYHPGTLTPDPAKMTWKDIEASRIDILKLSDVLIMLRSFQDLQCSLDIKQDSTELVREAVRAISAHRLEERVYLTAFQKKVPCLPMETDAKLLLFAKEINPKIKTHIMAAFPANLPKLHRIYSPDAISFGWLHDPPWFGLLSQMTFKTMSKIVDLRDQIAYLKFRGVKTWGGIVNDVSEMQYFAELGVDGMVTDSVQRGCDFKKSWEGRR